MSGSDQEDTLSGNPLSATRDRFREPTPWLRAGDRIAGAYVVERFIAAGGMGQVFRARDERLERPVAIKLLHPDVASSELGLTRFEREAKALSRVVHPNVVGTFAFGTHGGSHYLVMELVDGPSLEEVLIERGRLPMEETIPLARQIGAGLEEAHALGMIHRDVKPGNILLHRLRSGGHLAKVVDFGLACGLDDQSLARVTATAVILGSPTYMSPEQVMSRELDGRSDLYAFAVVIYHMLVGKPPFGGATMQAMMLARLTQSPSPLTDHVEGPRVAAVWRVLEQGMALEPSERFGSVSEFVEALARAAGRAVTEELDLVSCGVCRTQVLPTSRFCGGCGTAMPLPMCEVCGTERTGERYRCQSCGASLLPRANLVRSSVSDLSQEPDQRGDLVSVTAVALVAQATRDDLPLEAAREFYEIFSATVEREHGRVLALLGHEAVGVFGLGGMGSREVEQAVDAAMALQRAVDDAWRAEASGETPVRMGLELGQILTRGSGISWGMALATGAAVEEARRAAQAAPQGGVFLGEESWAEVRGIYETRIVGGFRRVEARRPIPLEVSSAGIAGRQIPLLARDYETAHLSRAFERVVRNGQLVVVPIVGPAGVGKSRLMAELLRALEDEGARYAVGVGRCLPSEGAPPCSPFRTIFRARYHLRDEDDPALTRERLRGLAGIRDLPDAVAAERVKHLCRLLGLGDPDPASRPQRGRHLGAEPEQDQAFEAVVEHFRGLAAEAPVVLILDDLQWARPTTLKLVSYLAQACVELPVLMLLGMRQQGAGRLLDDALRLPARSVATIDVPPLREADTGALLASVLGERVAPEELVKTIHALSGGVPQEIEGQLKALISEGAFVQGEEGWSVDAEVVGNTDLPESLSELVVKRVGRLVPAERRLLSTAAVAGDPFTVSMVTSMMQREVGESEFEGLVNGGWLMLSQAGTFAPEREYVFRQASVREILLEVLTPSRSRSLHKRAASWLDSQVDVKIPGREARLALHYEATGDAERGARSTLEKAREAQAGYGNEEAYETFGKALGMAHTLVDITPDSETGEVLLEAALGRARLGLVLGRHEEALAAVGLVEGMGLGGAHGERLAQALALKGDLCMAMGRYDEAENAFQDAQTHAAGVPGLEVYTRGRVSMALINQGRLAEACEVAGEVLASAPEAEQAPAPLLRGLGSAAGVLADAHQQQGDLEQAKVHYEMAKDFRVEADDGVGAAMALLGLGNCAFWDGDPEAAARVYAEVAAECETLGFQRGVAIARSNQGEALLAVGELTEGLGAVRVAEGLMRRLGTRYLLADTLRVKSQALIALGEAEAAGLAAEEALALATEFGAEAQIQALHDLIAQLSG